MKGAPATPYNSYCYLQFPCRWAPAMMRSGLVSDAGARGWRGTVARADSCSRSRSRGARPLCCGSHWKVYGLGAARVQAANVSPPGRET